MLEDTSNGSDAKNYIPIMMVMVRLGLELCLVVTITYLYSL